jgi:hypothetical protein
MNNSHLYKCYCGFRQVMKCDNPWVRSIFPETAVECHIVYTLSENVITRTVKPALKGTSI